MRRLSARLILTWLLLAVGLGSFLAPISGVVPSAHAVNIRQALGENPDGVRSTAFKCVAVDRSDCAPPTVADIDCDDALAPSLSGLYTGTPLAHNWRQYFSGDDADTCTLGVRTDSGDNAATEGFAFDGNNLEHPADNAGAGALSITCTEGGSTKACPSRGWSFQAPPVGDVTAPPVPTGLTATSLEGAVYLEWDGVSDASGIDHYTVKRNGSTITTVEPNFAFAQPSATYNVGAGSTPAPTVSVNGTTTEITAEGLWDTTADRGTMRGWQLTGDFSISSCLSALDNPANNTRFGLVARPSLDAGSRSYSAYYRYSATAPSFRTTYRPTDGATTTTQTPITGATLPKCKKIERVGLTTLNSYTGDGSTWSLFDTVSGVTWPDTIYAGMFVSSQSGAATTTKGTFTNVSVQAAVKLNYTHTTASAGNYTVNAVDNATNASADTAAVTGTPLVSANAVRWHPGNYVLSHTVMRNTTTVLGYTNAELDEVGAMPNAAGWMQWIAWKVIEPTRGNYNFAPIDAILNRMAGHNKQFVLYVITRSFAGSDPSYYLPSYLATEPNGAGGWCLKNNGSPTGVIEKSWLQAIMDRKIALVNALAERYNDNPNFEGMVMGESDPGQGYTACTDFSFPAFVAQQKRLYTAGPLAFTKASYWAQINFAGGQSNVAELIATSAAARGSVSATDILLSGGGASHSDRVLRGERWIGNTWVAGAGTDYRGVIGIGSDSEGPSMGGKEGGFTILQLYNAAFNDRRLNHIFWLMKKWEAAQTNCDLYWRNDQSYAVNECSGNDIKTHINSGNPTRTTCPSSWPSCNTN